MVEASEKLSHQIPTPPHQVKLNEFFDNVVKQVCIDYNNQEMQDIQTAVNTMLQRIVNRANKRGMFSISRIQSAGSLAEKTSIWKYNKDKNPYVELDFLAVLEHSTQGYYREQNKSRETVCCTGCTKLLKCPVNLKHLKKNYIEEDEFNAHTLQYRMVVSYLFLKEINLCLTLSCECLSVSFSRPRDTSICQHEISFRRRPTKHGCDDCTVDMPTGFLSVNTSIFIDGEDVGPANCSLIFFWTSKAYNLAAPDMYLLREPQNMSTLPIYVDFLPALEFRKPTLSGKEQEHDCYIVPKNCNTCEIPNVWRKSWCITEINEFVNNMSEKHRQCYQIIKYILSIVPEAHNVINNYHVKTIVLQHTSTCLDTTDKWEACVIKMLQDLLHALKEGGYLEHFQEHINILTNYGHCDESSSIYQQLLDLLSSVSNGDTWDTFVSKIKLIRFPVSGW